MRKIALALLVAISLLFPVSVHAKELTPIRFMFDLGPMGNHSWIIRAIEDGTFRDNGFDVKIVGTGPGSVKTGMALSAAKADVGYQDFSGVVIVNNKQPQAQFKAIFVVDDKSQDGLFFLKGSNIKTWEDIRGKKVGGFPTSVTRNLLKLVTDIEPEYIFMPHNLRAPALVSGQVDAIEGFLTTTIYNLKKIGVTEYETLQVGADMPFTVSRVITASNEWLNKYPGADIKLRTALETALKNHIADPRASVMAMKGPLVNTEEGREIEMQRAEFNINKLIVTDGVRHNGLNNWEYLEPRLDQYIDVLTKSLDLPYRHAHQEYRKLK